VCVSERERVHVCAVCALRVRSQRGSPPAHMHSHTHMHITYTCTHPRHTMHGPLSHSHTTHTHTDTYRRAHSLHPPTYPAPNTLLSTNHQVRTAGTHTRTPAHAHMRKMQRAHSHEPAHAHERSGQWRAYFVAKERAWSVERNYSVLL